MSGSSPDRYGGRVFVKCTSLSDGHDGHQHVRQQMSQQLSHVAGLTGSVRPLAQPNRFGSAGPFVRSAILPAAAYRSPLPRDGWLDDVRFDRFNSARVDR